MGNMRRLRRSIEEDRYFKALQKQYEQRAKTDTGTDSGLDKAGPPKPSRSIFNPDGEFPVATAVPVGVTALAAYMQQQQQGGKGGEVKQDGGELPPPAAGEQSESQHPADGNHTEAGA